MDPTVRRALFLTAPFAVLALLTACSGGSEAATGSTGAATGAATTGAEGAADTGALDVAALGALQLTADELGEGWTALDTTDTATTDPSSLLPEGAEFDPAVCGEQVLALQQGSEAAPDALSSTVYTKDDGTVVGVTLAVGDDYSELVFEALTRVQQDCATYTVTFPELFTASYAMTSLDTVSLGDRSDAVLIAMTMDGAAAGSTAMLLSQVGDVVVSVMTTGLEEADTALLEQAATQAVDKVSAGV